MIQTEDEPVCGQAAHGWYVLGTEDNGETVSRCGSCMVLKYELDEAVRYEVPE